MVTGTKIIFDRDANIFQVLSVSQQLVHKSIDFRLQLTTKMSERNKN